MTAAAGAAERQETGASRGRPAGTPAHPVSGAQAPEASEATGWAIEVEDLAIRYRGKLALSGVTLQVPRHEIFGVIGPANSGKTSFLRAINRMDLMTAGMDGCPAAVRVEGRDVRSWRNPYALRQRIGVVFPLPVGLADDGLRQRRAVVAAARHAEEGRPGRRSSNAACGGPRSGTR